MGIRVGLARLLRRLAQRLSPVTTRDQIDALRDYYDHHDTVTGQLLKPDTRINVNGDFSPDTLREMRRYRDAWTSHHGW